MPVFINTTLTIPGPIKHLTITELNPTNVTISWDPPDDNQNCIYGYAVYWEGSQDKTPETNYTIENLEPCLLYIIRVCVIDIEGKEGACSSIQIKMAVDKSDEIRSLEMQYTNEGLTIVEWQKPLYAAECIAYYRVLVMLDELYIVEDDVKETKIEIQNLTACQLYIIQIVPVNENLGDGGFTRLDLETGVKIPIPPEQPILIYRTKSSLQLSSEYFDETNACYILFGRFICREYDTTYNVTKSYVSKI